MIFWTLRARRRIEQALAASPQQVATTMQQIDHLLQRTFPGETVHIVVQDQYAGYRPNPYQFVLLVEVERQREGQPRVRPVIVKFNLEPGGTNLQTEWEAWLSCRPHGLDHDIVLMTLEPHADESGVFALVYGDAQQFIGVSRTCSLEEAILDAVQSGSPSILSVRVALFQLFERLGQLLYATSYDDPPGVEPARTLPVNPDILRFADVWKAHPDRVSVRKTVDACRGVGPGLTYSDPVDYLDYLQKVLAKSTTGRHASGTAFLPTTRRGRSHGDLHGRNILVGVTDDDQVVWPAVFDFEKMGQHNPIALDFIKLETELKSRALVRILHGREIREFIALVQRFETALARWTQHCQNGDRWPELHEIPSFLPSPTRAPGAGLPPPQPDDPPCVREQQRLLAVLLEIRRRAAIQLGIRAGRPTDWLRQYLFWQLCYGVRVVTFTNLNTFELAASYVSAGVAAHRLQEMLEQNSTAGR